MTLLYGWRRQNVVRIIIVILYILASESVKLTFSTKITAQLTDNDEVLNICIDNKVHAFHLDFQLDKMPTCYYRTEIYLPGSVVGENKTDNNKCCIDLTLLNTVRSSNNFTLIYKIVIGPVKKNINIIMKDARTEKELDEVTFQRSYGPFKMVQVQQGKLQMQMIFPKTCFEDLMFIHLNYSFELCSFTLYKYGSSDVKETKDDKRCSMITFDKGEFSTNDEMLLKFEIKQQIDRDLLVQVVVNKLIMKYFVVKGNDIGTEDTNYLPSKIDVSSSSSNNVDNSQTQVYLKLPLLKEIVGNMTKFSVVVAHTNGIISKRGVLNQPDKFIDKTYEECQFYFYYQKQQQQKIWKDCVYEVNVTEAVSSTLFDDQSNYTGFILGKMNKCTKQDKYFCNGPLRPGQFYNVSLRVYSRASGKYRTSDPVEVKTDMETIISSLVMWSVTSTVIVVVIILAILIIIIVCIKVHRNKRGKINENENPEEHSEDEDVYSYIRPRSAAATAAATSSNTQQPLEDNSVYSVIDESHEPHYTCIDSDAAIYDRPGNTINEERTDNTVEMSNFYETNVAAKSMKQNTTTV